MTEAEWRACGDPDRMLDFLGGRATDRKLRLFAVACCRSVWYLIPETPHRAAVLVAERHADGEATDAELGAAVSAVHRARRRKSVLDHTVYDTVRCRPGGRYSDAGIVSERFARVGAYAAAPDPSGTWTSYFVGDRMVSEAIPPNADRLVWNAMYARHRLEDAARVRDVFGDPFRPVVVHPAWLTSTVTALAEGAYQRRDFTDLPILADALQDAGCEDEGVLGHCRDAGPHTRGCFVIDSLLGNS